MGAPEITEFLTDLAVRCEAAPSTQADAGAERPRFPLQTRTRLEPVDFDGLVKARRPRKVPVVLTVAETKRLLRELDGTALLMAQLLYGAGLRTIECVRLREQDVDFGRGGLTLQETKGSKGRTTLLPEGARAALTLQIARARELYRADRAAGAPGVALPHALAEKLPRAAQEWSGFWLFPSPVESLDPRSGLRRRHHVY